VRNSVKNVPDKLGILRAVPANEPAVTFDEQGRNLGYLPESARTNLLRWSEDFTQSSVWAPFFAGTGTAPAVTSDAGLSPTGEMTADSIELNLNGGTTFSDRSYIRQGVTVVVGDAYVAQIYLKAFDASQVGKKIFVSIENTAFINRIVELQSEWTLYEFSVVPTAINVNFGFQLRGSIDVAENAKFLAWGAQLEAGSFASSYIKTEASTATRPADNLTFTDASDFIGQSEGVIYAEVDLSLKPTNRVILSLSDGASSVNSLVRLGYLQIDNKVYGQLGSASVQTTASVGKNKLIAIYTPTEISFFYNGVNIGSTAGTPLTKSAINIGVTLVGANQYNDPIRSVRLWKTADWCDDATAQLLTRI